MTATKTTRTTTRKAPTDRQPTKSERLAAAEQLPAGHDLLTPVEQLRSSQQAAIQAELFDLFDALGFDFNEAKDAQEKGQEVRAEVETTPEAIRAIGRMGEILEAHVPAEKHDAYVKFDTGRGALTRVMELGMWYLARLGESDGSAS